jgi:hypothetical protein
MSGTVLKTLYGFFIFPTTLWVGYYYVIDEETEAQSSWVTYSKSQLSEVTVLGFKPSRLALVQDCNQVACSG